VAGQQTNSLILVGRCRSVRQLTTYRQPRNSSIAQNRATSYA